MKLKLLALTLFALGFSALAFQNCSKSSDSAEPSLTQKDGGGGTGGNGDTGGFSVGGQSFTASATQTGTYNNANVAVQIKFSSEHQGKRGYVFVAAANTSHILYCTEPATPTLQGKWIQDTAGAMKYFEYLPPAGYEGYIVTNFNLAEVAGAKVYAGYGLGNTMQQAYDEMMANQRYLFVKEVKP